MSYYTEYLMRTPERVYCENLYDKYVLDTYGEAIDYWIGAMHKDLYKTIDCNCNHQLKKERKDMRNPYRISIPQIANYSYCNGTTTIIWRDGTKTTCHADPEKADQYTGFMIAVAKYAMGNGNQATNFADYWINKLPARKEKEEKKKLAAETEARRIEEKRRKRRAQNRIRKAAIRRAEEYAAKKLAFEKYGVPEEFSCTLEEIGNEYNER